jgi:hypothetical protein
LRATGRLICMQRRLCHCDPRDVVASCADAAHATADYTAGYADGLADLAGMAD